MEILYKLIRPLISSIIKLLSEVHSPGSVKKIHYKTVLDFKKVAKPGDIILTRTEGYLSTLVIPGFWKHAAIYCGEGKIIDAIRAGVSERYLEDLLMSSDNICLLRVKYISNEQVSDLLWYARGHVGYGYDFEFDLGTKNALYCSELVYYSVNYAKQSNYLELKDSFGVPAITPQDLYEMRDKFEQVLEIRTK